MKHFLMFIRRWMPSLSLEGQGRFKTQSLRASQAGGLFGLHGRQQILRAHHCPDGKARPLHNRNIAESLARLEITDWAVRQRGKASQAIWATALASDGQSSASSPLGPGRRRKITYVIEAKNISQCLRTSHYLPTAPQGSWSASRRPQGRSFSGFSLLWSSLNPKQQQGCHL